MNISRKTRKNQLALITLLIITPYLCMFYWWVKDHQYAYQLTLAFFLGMLVVFLRKVDEGVVMHLSFQGKLVYEKDRSLVTLENGYYLIPALWPILHYFDIYLLWRIVPEKTSEEAYFTPKVNIDDHRDQRKPHWVVKSEVSLRQQMVARFIENIGSWFFSFNKEEEMKFQGLGTKMVAVTLLVSWVCVSTIPTLLPTGWQHWNILSNKSASTVEVAVNVPMDSPPLYVQSFFEKTHAQDEQIVKEEGGTFYVLYQETLSGAPPQVTIGPHTCAMVPPGMRINFKTIFPPKYVVNMNSDVRFVIKEDFAPWYQKTLPDGVVSTNGWKYLTLHWNEVHPEYQLQAQALQPNGSIPSTHIGGMVCF